jgi:acetyl-CoA carboxylase biotin carboxyl carrier protein
MDIDLLRKLMEFMKENDLVELEYEDGGRRVRLRKAEPRAIEVLRSPPTQVELNPQPVETEKPVEKKPEKVVEFNSPLVGTFYRSPKPGERPYVEVGDEVNPESIVCVIEAMKVMNEIKAEMRGIIKEVIVKDGQPVEYGEPLFLIERLD